MPTGVSVVLGFTFFCWVISRIIRRYQQNQEIRRITSGEFPEETEFFDDP